MNGEREREGERERRGKERGGEEGVRDKGFEVGHF